MINKKELIVRSIKIIDIGFITVIYFTLGLLIAELGDKLLGKFDEKKAEKKSIIIHIFDLVMLLWLFGIITYFMRNIVPLIPFPLNGIYGFQHNKVNELKNASSFSFSFILFQKYYRKKMEYIFLHM